MTDRWIVGAGMTGLAAGIASGTPVLERLDRPGGICASYQKHGYRFELGGGHWIFGADPQVTELLAGASELRSYQRRAAVLFLGGCESTQDLRGVFVPYPIQENLCALPANLRDAALAEVLRENHEPPAGTMAAWLEQRYGPSLCRVFFHPFHERYTGGLYREIAPQDSYKSPLEKERVLRGAERQTRGVGYNAVFLYPAAGLDTVSRRLAERCDVRYEATVTRIDTGRRCIELEAGPTHRYDSLLVTAPLSSTVELAGLGARLGPPDPHTSVLVLNLGVTLPDTPLARHGCHWLYIPDSRTGFHRIGYYSNVDPWFLGERRNDPASASLYVETAFRGGRRPSPEALSSLTEAMIQELKDCGLVGHVETWDTTWIEFAYTWQRPASDWVARATAACRECGIEPAGRYGRWSFQGIAASLKEGLRLGGAACQA